MVLLADGMIDLRLGRWQEVLADVETCDAVICDPPYSPRQGEGFRSGNDYARGGGEKSGTHFGGGGTITAFLGMPYAPIDQEHADELATRFCGAKWIVAFGDHISFRWHEEAAKKAGRYCFAPVVWVRGNTVRFQGDGPCSAAEYICVSRPREKCSIGSLPGVYIEPFLNANVAGASRVVTGQKPLGLMQAIIRDYTRPGDLVVDPFCGGGTTALACAIEGRRCITSEMDPVTFEKARKRLSRGFTPSMFRQGPRVKAKQGSLV